MDDYYYGISLDGNIVESRYLKDICENPHIDFFLKKVYQNTVGVSPCYKYMPIDKYDKFKAIKIGNYELIDIGPDFFNNGRQRILTYLDITTQKKYQRYSYVYSIKFMSTEVLPLLNDLIQFGNLDNYERFESISKENNELLEDNNRLKKTINELEQQLNELKDNAIS